MMLYVALIGFWACQAPQNEELARWEAQAKAVEIIRDDFGVAFIGRSHHAKRSRHIDSHRFFQNDMDAATQ